MTLENQPVGAEPEEGPAEPQRPVEEPPPPRAEPVSPPKAPPAPAEVPHHSRRPRLIGLALVVALLAFLAVLVTMNQRTPYTSEAVLQAQVIGIAANVSGDIVEVGVRDNQRVKAGDLIFQIDPALFQAAVDLAEAQLDNIIQQLGAESTGLGAAEASLVQANSRLADVEQQNIRTEALFLRGIVPRAAVDSARANLSAAQSATAAAEAQLAQAKQRLGPEGNDNPQVRAVQAQRTRAQIDLMHARVVAPVDGAITNTTLSVGQFVGAGKNVATLIDTADPWIIAQIPENSIGGIRPGDAVDIVLDVAPGRVFRGTVESTGWGVDQVVAAGLQGDLPTPVERRVWLRDVQRIPVRISIDDLDPEVAVRAGARATVMIYTQNAGAFTPVAQAWIRAVAYLSYAF